ncbi:bifunctional metallophosphatase/5'-nucleotidase [Marinobacter fonticola]|uniref:bifunctional metallophosphatase/5'-nucleotidase n=1 Tax=Marinobacter fonticola TaxID=2603215 RepID=UPI0011E7F8BF|nr:5'-nucleotidase C-terminal domain-containing protein [Marinobacter fonticola]
MEFRKTLLGLAVCAAVVGLAGCSDDDDDNDNNENSEATGDYSLQLLHFADVDGAPGAIEEVDRFSALIEAFRAEQENTLLVSSGDNVIPGPRYFAAADKALVEALGVPGNGRADIAFMNAMGVDVSAIGNHDLDGGPAEFRSMLTPQTDDEDASLVYEGAAFPFVSANLDVTTESALADLATGGGQQASSIAGKIAPSTVVSVNGEQIGVVGATTPSLASITSTGNITIAPDVVADEAQFYDDLAAEIQPAVDALVDSGINKIVLVAHMQQIAIEKALATRLNGVDVIVAGGSNTLLADADDSLRDGDVAADTYPLAFESPEGEPVLVVNVDGDYKYLGRLVLNFDENGVIKTGELDPAVNGAWASTDAIVDQVMGEPVERVTVVSAEIREVLAARDGNILGQTSVYLDGRRGEVRTEETNLGNLTAEANLWYAKQFDPSVVVSLKNGGGIRSAIGQIVQPAGSNDPADAEFEPPVANEAVGKEAGDVSQFDIEGSLRFNNSVALLTVTGAELHDLLEHAVAATEVGATPGQFPQVAGMRFSFDPAETARTEGDTNTSNATSGQRIQSLVVETPGGDVTVVENGMLVSGQESADYRLATLGFLAACVPTNAGNDASASCGDGYPFKSLTSNLRTELEETDGADDPGATDFAAYGTEQDALAEYLQAEYPPEGAVFFDQAETDAANDERIQNLSVRSDTVITLTAP